MTNEERIKLLEAHRDYEGEYDNNEEMVETLNAAIDALKKQIPSKITHNFKCPACYADVIGSGHYCWKCGQHLDWGKRNAE